MKRVSALKSDNFLIASRKFAPLAQMLRGGGRGGRGRICNLCEGSDYRLFTADGNSLAPIPGQPLTRDD